MKLLHALAWEEASEPSLPDFTYVTKLLQLYCESCDYYLSGNMTVIFQPNVFNQFESSFI